MTKLFLVIAVLMGLCFVARPAPAMAFDILGGVNCNDPQNATSAACSSKAKTDAQGNPINPLTGPDGALIKVTNIVAYVAGAAAIILIIVSAIRFVTSGSDISTNSRTDTDVETAKRTIANAIIGLIVIVLGRTLIVFVLKRM